jgi:phage shock protein A
MTQDHAMEDTDLSNMSPGDAREYVLAFLTALKQTTIQKRQVEQELETWRGRIQLAQDRAAADLAARAAGVVSQLEAKLATLAAEEAELDGKARTLKENLRRLEITGRRLVDTDLLQAELDLAVGEDKAAEIETDRALRKAQADAALEELKRRMGGGKKDGEA